VIYNKEERKIVENPDNAYELIYGLSNPSKETIKQRIQSKINVCDYYYLPFFNEHVSNKSQKTVLEFGSGFGVMANYLSPLFKKYFCVDVNEFYLSECKRYTEERSNVEYFLLKDYMFNGVDLSNKSVDIIKSTNVFIHLNIYQFIIYLRKFYSLLRPGGLLIFDIYDSDILSWNDNNFSNHIENYKKQGKFTFTFKPISGKMVKEELTNMGFDLIYENLNSNGTNILGFKKRTEIL